MHNTRETLSVKEMDDIIGIQSAIKNYHIQGGDIDQENLDDFTEKLNTSLTTLITLSQRRKMKLMKLLSYIERERGKVLACVDTENLTAPATKERAGKLEKMINEYFCLNEGFDPFKERNSEQF